MSRVYRALLVSLPVAIVIDLIYSIPRFIKYLRTGR